MRRPGCTRFFQRQLNLPLAAAVDGANYLGSGEGWRLQKTGVSKQFGILDILKLSS
jgi:hypothetical protein